MSSSKAPVGPTAAGSSSNPTTLHSLWTYLLPALDHIISSPVSGDCTKAPAIDVGYYAGIHTACYNYITASADGKALSSESSDAGTADLYKQLDQYFSDVAREHMLGMPDDSIGLIHYLIPCFNRYSAGAQSVNRLLNYVNRHYVRRFSIDEDKGWFSVTELLPKLARTVKPDDKRTVSKLIQERRIAELKKWGYMEGGSTELMAQAEASAEAASPLDRIVPIVSLAHRRFRVEIIEPLLMIPKLQGKKGKNKAQKNNAPKGRLARAVKELLESDGIEQEERIRLSAELAKMLRVVGVRADHPLRKKLDKFSNLNKPAASGS